MFSILKRMNKNRAIYAMTCLFGSDFRDNCRRDH